MKVLQAEFVVLTFDGWCTYHNVAVLGFMLTVLKDDLTMQIRCLCNFRMTFGHSSDDIQIILRQVVQERMSGRYPSYFVSDSASVNKAAVRTFMGCDDDDF